MKKWTERRLRETVTNRFVIELNMPKSYPPIKARPTEEGGVIDRFHASRKELPDEITVVRPFSTKGFDKNIGCVLYVAEDGCDTAEGTRELPLATLHEALRRVYGKGGAKIIMRGGNYTFAETAKITSAHSGTETSPLIITSEDGEKAHISGSTSVPVSAFKPLTDEAMLSRLKPEAREKVLVCDLPSVGITEYGVVGAGGTKLLYNSKPLDLCRYPNAGEELIHVTKNIFSYGFNYDGTPSEPWEIECPDDRPKSWQWNDGIYIFGALCYEWTRLCRHVAEYDPVKKSIKGDGAFDRHPVRYDIYNTYFFQNVFEELDVPGEWYLDRESGRLYLYPPKGALTESDDIRLITKSGNLIECDGAENVIIDGLNIGRCAGSAIFVTNSTQVLIQRCHVIGTSFGHRCGESAVTVSGGERCGFIASKIEEFTNEVAKIDGGDRKYLIPSNNFMQNCILMNGHNRFGIRSSGCGNVISHNYLHNTTMGDAGHNEGILEYNVCEGGDTETHDTGMIYVGGGGLSSCANHYRYNYFFDFDMGDYGIYFDDLSRGMYAYGNIVVGNGTTGDGTTWKSGGRGYNHHNGGEHSFYNNISIDAGYFAFGGDVSYWNDEGMWQSLAGGIGDAANGMRDSEIYFDRNPTYRDFVRWYDQYREDIKDPNYVSKSGEAERRLRSPWYNNYENNLIVRAARPYKLDHGEETATNLETNYITNEDPGFVDFEGRDYRFKPDAEVFKQIPGFIAPPFEKMGPVDDYE